MLIDRPVPSATAVEDPGSRFPINPDAKIHWSLLLGGREVGQIPDPVAR